MYSLEAELKAREEELRELLKAVDALQNKVPPNYMWNIADSIIELKQLVC